jgi:hypothetical protein
MSKYSHLIDREEGGTGNDDAIYMITRVRDRIDLLA